MARKKSDNPRDHQLNFSLTRDEALSLQSRALAVGMHIIPYGRELLFREGPPPGPADAALMQFERMIYIQLRRLGANLNQIARRLNTLREPAPPSLAPLLTEIRNLLDAGFGHDR